MGTVLWTRRGPEGVEHLHRVRMGREYPLLRDSNGQEEQGQEAEVK